MKKAVVFLAPGFEEVEAMTPVDLLRRAGVDVVLAGLGSREIKGAHGISVKTDTTAEEISPEEFDCVVLPGGMPGSVNLSESQYVNKTVTSLYEKGKLVAAICAAPAVVLGPLGILEGKRFTCYPGFEARVNQGEFSEERVVHDGNLVTSRGPGTAMEFSLELIALLTDRSVSKKIKEGCLAL